MVRRRGWRSREEADQGQEQEGSVGVPVGEVEEAEIVLWEEWGPCAARVRLISPPTFHSTIVTISALRAFSDPVQTGVRARSSPSYS
jgi:hypothetical protein